MRINWAVHANYNTWKEDVIVFLQLVASPEKIKVSGTALQLQAMMNAGNGKANVNIKTSNVELASKEQAVKQYCHSLTAG